MQIDMNLLLPILASIFITWLPVSAYYENKIYKIEVEHLKELNEQVEESNQRLKQIIDKANTKYAEIQAEKESIRKSLADSKSDNRRMQQLLRELPSHADRDRLVKERDEFARLAVEANELLLEIDEGTRISEATSEVISKK